MTKTVHLVSSSDDAAALAVAFADWFSCYSPDQLCSDPLARYDVSSFCYLFGDYHWLPAERFDHARILATCPIDIWYAPQSNVLWALDRALAQRLANLYA